MFSPSWLGRLAIQVWAFPSRGSAQILLTPSCAHWRRSSSFLGATWVPTYILSSVDRQSSATSMIG